MSAPAEQPEKKKPNRIRNGIVTGVKLGLAVGLLAYLFVNGGLTWEILEKPLSSPMTITLVLVVGAAGLSLSGLRWWILLRAEGITVPLLMAVKLTWIGHFWNMVIPGAVSGDAVKMFYIGQLVPKDQREESWSIVFADRVIGLLALISLSTIAALASLDLMWPNPKLRTTGLIMIALLGAAVIGGVILALGIGRHWWVTAWLREKVPFGDGLARAYGALRRLVRRPGPVTIAYLISFVAHGMAVTNALLLGRLFTDALDTLQYYVLVPIGMFSNAVPLTPGGVGVGETILGSLFMWAGEGGNSTPDELNAAGASVMLWLRVIFYCLAVVGGLLYVLYKRKDQAVKDGVLDPAASEDGVSEPNAQP